MRWTKYIKMRAFLILAVPAFFYASSCTKDHAVLPTPALGPLGHNSDSVAQFAWYRLGKWYSITSGAQLGQPGPLKDTIWFIDDTLSAWSYGGLPYVYMKYYFPDIFHIKYITPDPNIPGKIDTVSQQCYMSSFTSDTFQIYWYSLLSGSFTEQYIKKRD